MQTMVMMTMMILTMMTMIVMVMMSWQKGTPGFEPGMVPLRIVPASLFPISIVSLLCVPLSIVPRSDCPIIPLFVVTLSVVHVGWAGRPKLLAPRAMAQDAVPCKRAHVSCCFHKTSRL